MKIFTRFSKVKALSFLVFTLFSFSSLFSQTNAPSIQSGVSFQWSDTQTVRTDPATIQSITVGTRVFIDFGSPQSYELTQLGPNGHTQNGIEENGVNLFTSSSFTTAWENAALSAFQDKNLNHYFEASQNGEAICDDFTAEETTVAQRQTFTYSPGVPSTSGSIIAITERNANNCYHIEFFGTLSGSSVSQSLGDTFVNPQGPTYFGHGGTGDTNNFGTVGTVVAPTGNADYWLSDRVVGQNGGTIGIALFYVNDIAPLGATITSVQITAANTDHGDGKLFIFSLADTDGDGFSDIDDLDDDDDGILDIDEANGFSPSFDADGDGIPNWNDTVNSGGTGDGSLTNYVDANGDGVPDVYDFDGDGIPNHLDYDSDNDGCFDALEGGDAIVIEEVLSDGKLDGTIDAVTGVPDNVDTTSGQTIGTSQDDAAFDTNGQCDRDNDGVLDGSDICQGSDDTVDTDNDGVPNGCDLDNDNDGILDANEGACASQVLSGTWVIAGNTASYDFGNGIIAQVTTNNEIDFTAGNFTNDAFWTENLAGSASLQNQYVWERTLTVNYVDALGNPVTVTNPIIYLDRVGGTDGVTTQNSAIVTLQNGLTWTTLSGTSDFGTSATTVFDSGNDTAADPAHVQDATQNDADGTAAGTMQINGEVSTFTLQFVQGGLFGTGTDGIEFILSACKSLDTDDDGTPDYLDNDSDDDGCPDSIEGGDTIDFSSVDASTGELTGDVNTTTGVPDDVNTTIGQTVGDATNDAVNACLGSVSGTIVDENGDPVSGVVVTLDDGDAATVDPTVTTGVDGTYEFTDVPAGDYTIVETVPANTDVVDGDTTDDGD
ncbi:carboxypeptidase regulatory-like domain-containing protein, partial [Olleya namhaensis]|uniref:carboxypeptidase regulatory-like domain-containing protein n=1 Tax=Olleya namhaensis TaxID=1144750 RepID=UPI002491E614